MRIEKGLIYKYSNLIFTNEELKKDWQEQLKHDLEDNENLEELKKKNPFKKWKEDLINTGEYKTVYIYKKV